MGPNGSAKPIQNASSSGSRTKDSPDSGRCYGRFVNTELGDAFRADAQRSVAGWARIVGRPCHWQAYAGLEPQRLHR
jgi:hypothetical protein